MTTSCEASLEEFCVQVPRRGHTLKPVGQPTKLLPNRSLPGPPSQEVARSRRYEKTLYCSSSLVAVSFPGLALFGVRRINRAIALRPLQLDPRLALPRAGLECRSAGCGVCPPRPLPPQLLTTLSIPRQTISSSAVVELLHRLCQTAPE